MAQIAALDAAVFIYALNADSEFGADALRVFKYAESGKLCGASSELTYLEAFPSAKLRLPDIVEAKRLFERLPIHFWPINMVILDQAAALRREHKSLKTPDAIHIASAIIHSCDYFITNDEKLLKLKFPGLEVINLADSQRLVNGEVL